MKRVATCDDGFVDFLFEIDEFADERGVFGDDHGGGVRDGGDGAVSAELADDLGEGVDRLGRLDVAEGHHIGNDRIAFGQRVVFIVHIDAAAGRADAAGGEGEDVEIGVLFIRDEDEVFDGGGLFEQFGGLGVGERILLAGILDEGKLGGAGGGGNDHAAAGVLPIETGQGVAAEFRLDDVLDDLVVAERDAGLRAGGIRTGFANGFNAGFAPGAPGAPAAGGHGAGNGDAGRAGVTAADGGTGRRGTAAGVTGAAAGGAVAGCWPVAVTQARRSRMRERWKDMENDCGLRME